MAPEGRTERLYSLDPENWEEFARLGRRMVDEMAAHTAGVRQRAVWRPMPEEARAEWRRGVPREGRAFEEVYEEFRRLIGLS